MKNQFKKKHAKFSVNLLQLLIDAKFDPETGLSDKYEMTPDVLERYYGNGDTLTRRGTALREHLVIRSYYRNGIERIDNPITGHHFEENGEPTIKKQAGGKYAFRLEGYSENTIPKAPVPAGMAKKMIASGIPHRCVWSGSTSSIQVDHPEGRPQKQGFTKSSEPSAYQFLTEHNNQVKRSACHHCVETGKRFNPKELLHTRIDFLEGDENFDIDGPGCKGCMLYDIKGFLSAL